MSVRKFCSCLHCFQYEPCLLHELKDIPTECQILAIWCRAPFEIDTTTRSTMIHLDVECAINQEEGLNTDLIGILGVKISNVFVTCVGSCAVEFDSVRFRSTQKTCTSLSILLRECKVSKQVLENALEQHFANRYHPFEEPAVGSSPSSSYLSSCVSQEYLSPPVSPKIEAVTTKSTSVSWLCVLH